MVCFISRLLEILSEVKLGLLNWEPGMAERCCGKRSECGNLLWHNELMRVWETSKSLLRLRFNQYWMTSQPHVTGQELTGNQCFQPPILYQYSVSLSHFKPAHLAISLALSVSCSVSLSWFFFHLCSLFLREPQHLYFKDVFVSLLCIPVIGLTGRRMQFWNGWVIELVGEDRQELALGVRFLLTRSQWGDDSWKSAGCICRNMFVTLPWKQAVGLCVAFPRGQTPSNN